MTGVQTCALPIYVSPQVWASRPGRATAMARDFDLLLSIFPFEKDWYAKHAPGLQVEFVGHPMVGRFANYDLRFTRVRSRRRKEADSVPLISSPPPYIGGYTGGDAPTPSENRKPQVLLLPGSRTAELQRHLPVMLGAWTLIKASLPAARAKMVLPNETLAEVARSVHAPADVGLQVGNLADALAHADLAIASTGTVTMECACFGVPTVALYKTSWSTYQIGKRIISVKFLAMPNLLANEEIFPEFIQHAATPENLSRAALDLLNDQARRHRIKTRLAEVITSLGGPGASQRAAKVISEIL